MGVTVCLPLFGNPGQELEEGSALKGQQLRDLAGQLHDRLGRAADTLDRLAAAGWSFRLAMYEVLLLHPDVSTREEVVRRLQALGLDARVYLTEAFGGGVAGLAIVVPAKVGPIDLGTVVTLAKLTLRPDAGVDVQTEDLPQIVGGIPTPYRTIELTIDRPGFMLNPTSCAPLPAHGAFTGAEQSLALRDGVREHADQLVGRAPLAMEGDVDNKPLVDRMERRGVTLHAQRVLQVLEDVAPAVRPDEIADLVPDAGVRQRPARRRAEDVEAADALDDEDDAAAGLRRDHGLAGRRRRAFAEGPEGADNQCEGGQHVVFSSQAARAGRWQAASGDRERLGVRRAPP